MFSGNTVHCSVPCAGSYNTGRPSLSICLEDVAHYCSGCTIFRLVGPGLCVASISTLLVAAVACVCTIATSVITGVERSVRANCIEVAVGYVFESLLLFVNWRIDF